MKISLNRIKFFYKILTQFQSFLFFRDASQNNYKNTMLVNRLIKKNIVICLPHIRLTKRSFCKTVEHYENVITRETEVVTNKLVPELKLHLITKNCSLFHSKVDESFPFKSDPFFAFFWPGGISVTRYLFDNPKVVRNKSLLDFGAGCGATAIAAKMCGAKKSVANDIDEVSMIAAKMNAKLNGVEIETDARNLINHPDSFEYDVIFFGDVFYDEEFANLLLPWIEKLLEQTKTRIIIGDPNRHAFNVCKHLNIKLLGRYELPENVCIENHGFQFGYVWEMHRKS